MLPGLHQHLAVRPVGQAEKIASDGAIETVVPRSLQVESSRRRVRVHGRPQLIVENLAVQVDDVGVTGRQDHRQGDVCPVCAHSRQRRSDEQQARDRPIAALGVADRPVQPDFGRQPVGHLTTA